MDAASWTAVASIVVSIVTAVSANQALKYKASAANVDEIERTMRSMLMMCEKREKECLEENERLRKKNSTFEVRIATLEAQVGAVKP